MALRFERRIKLLPGTPPRGRARLRADSLQELLPTRNVSPAHTVFPGCVFLLRAAKAIEVGCYVDILKSEILQHGYQLCLRQSTSDSISPQSNVAASFSAEWGIEHYIGKL